MALMEDPQGHHWGYDLTKRAGIRSGVLYPTLRRMEAEGWLDDGWEDPETVSGRPPRRYYELTDEGRAALGGMIEQARREGKSARMRGGLALDA
jgi:PadR family transcriptional regulator PadR